MSLGRNGSSDKGGFAALINPLAVLIAIFITIAFTGKLYWLTQPYVTDYILGEYGPTLARIASWLWFPLVAASLFLGGRVIVAFILNIVFVTLLGVGLG
ncbi:MAG: hypothetical protein WCY11_12240 [Novosphingobium sp.]